MWDKPKNTSDEPLFAFLEQPVQTDPFGNNKNGDRAYRRLEKIVAAVFLTTNHMPDDYLKEEVRQCSLAALPALMSLRNEMRAQESQKVSELLATLRRLISLLKILVLSGRVSEQNASVIIAAIDDCSGFVSVATKSPLSEEHALSKYDLLNDQSFFKGHIKDRKDGLSIKDTAQSTALALGSVRTHRSAAILSILRSDIALSIKDVAAHLPEWGEKTVQRELNTLIDAGLVRRIGSRRWSTYSLAVSGVGESGRKD